MTPCGYDARNYQPDWELFAALDLWNAPTLLTRQTGQK